MSQGQPGPEAGWQSARFDLSAGLSEALVDSIRMRCQEILRSFGAETLEIKGIMMVVEELATNVLDHSGARWMDLAFRPEGGSYALRISDNGAAFDPSKEEPGQDWESSFQKESTRQWGLYLVRKLTESMSYRRDPDGVNELRLQFKSGRGAPKKA